MGFIEQLGVLDSVVVVIMMAGLIFVSIFFTKNNKSAEEYNNAGKSLTIWLVVGSTIATFMGSYSGLGAPQLILAAGLSGLTAGLMFHVGWIALCFMAKPLRASGVNTLSEFLAVKYGGQSTRTVGAIVTVVFVFSSIAGQFIACGTMAQVLGISTLRDGIIYGGLMIILLSMFGGLKGVAITNTIQSVFIAIVCVIAIPVMSFVKAGGFMTVMNDIKTTSPQTLNFFAGMAPMTLIGYVLSNLLSAGSSPSYTQRILVAKDVKTGVRGSIISNLLGVCFTIPIALGVLCVPYILPNVTDGSHYMPQMILTFFPPVLKGIAVFSFASLFLTTGDANLMLASSVVANDLIKVAKPDIDDRKLYHISRISVVVIGLISIAVAVNSGTIYEIMMLGSAVYGAAIFIPLFLGCFFSKNRTYNYKFVNAGMLCGCFVTLIWNWLLVGVTGIAGVIVGALACLFLCLAGSKKITGKETQ
ncbi:MAG: sodium:solute symporter family protein [Enterocloster asparagiformis]|nr:sodium:solute symporter family protein [Enterocloster asparagiformis]